MEINRQNIELIFFEYLEGNLTLLQTKELFAFLEQNPDLKNEFENYQQIKLQPKPIKYSKKERLKKEHQFANDFEILCIRFIENDLTENEKNDFLKIIAQDAEKQQIFSKYQKTKLLPKLSLKYKNKEQLYKLEINTFDEKCIAYIEKQLSKDEKNILLKEIKNNSEKNKIFTSYKNTILEPDTQIRLENKNRLKKQSTSVLKFLWPLSAAASIIVFFIFSFYHFSHKNMQSNYLAANSILKPYIIRTVYTPEKNNSFSKTIINQNVKIKKIEKSQTELALIKNDVKNDTTTIDIQNKTIETKVQYAEQINTENNDSIVKLSLEKLFAQNKFNYFHQMIEELNYEKQAFLPNHKGSWWNMLENGTKYIQQYTGNNIIVKEQRFEKEQRIKQEITLGNFSFSRSFSKK
ncbi:MAG: hypothetical protein HPY79_08985 [Bacteroidales bacterium]|nr:hypothetical protein [Bacteroidales bacterium]